MDLMKIPIEDPEPCPTGEDSLDDMAYATAVLLVIGTFASFLPQHIKIIKNASHYGLSLSNFWLGSLTTCLSNLNYLALSWDSTFRCCGPDVPTRDCVGAYLAFLQQIAIYVCTHLVIVLFLIYYDHELEARGGMMAGQNRKDSLGFMETSLLPPAAASYTYDYDEDVSPIKGNARSGSIYRRAVRLVLSLVALEAVLGGVLVWMVTEYGTDSYTFRAYGAVLGLVAIVTISSRWIPQIYLTWKLGETGSLSMIMLCTQTVGSILTAYVLSTHGGALLWSRYLVTAGLQMWLCLVVAVFSWRKRKQSKSLQVPETKDYI